MKSIKSTLIISFIALTHCSYSQSDNSFGSGGGNTSDTINMWESIPTEILNNINTFLENRGLKGEYRIANFNNEKYFLMIPLKQEDRINLIWADYHFNKEGVCNRIVTKISNMDDVDCSVLGNKLCGSIFKLSRGYQKEFGSQYNDILYVYEIGSHSYFEVYHPNKNETKIKFDFQGNRMLD